MSLSAEMQWQLLPPLMMTTPRVAVAGALEPAYDVAGDSFDYALKDDVLHMAMIDAMGHGLSAAVMATLAVGAYRHARRHEAGLAGLYEAMDTAIAGQLALEQRCWMFGVDPLQRPRGDVEARHLSGDKMVGESLAGRRDGWHLSARERFRSRRSGPGRRRLGLGP